MEVFTIDLTLNLMPPLVVLTYVTTYSSESTNSSILNLLHTNDHVYDFEISIQSFRLCVSCVWVKISSQVMTMEERRRRDYENFSQDFSLEDE